jgi:hypothetical protein
MEPHGRALVSLIQFLGSDAAALVIQCLSTLIKCFR